MAEERRKAKLYMVFGGDVYYPLGGMDDCVGTFTDRQAAYAKLAETAEQGDPNCWAHIAILYESGEILKIDWKKSDLNLYGEDTTRFLADTSTEQEQAEHGH